MNDPYLITLPAGPVESHNLITLHHVGLGSLHKHSVLMLSRGYHKYTMLSWLIPQNQDMLCLLPLLTCGCVFLLLLPQDKEHTKKKYKQAAEIGHCVGGML